jgi:hypothetical protein
MRFIMQCQSKEDAMKAVTLLKAYRPWCSSHHARPPRTRAPRRGEAPALTRVGMRVHSRMPKLEPAAGTLLIRACLRSDDLDLALQVRCLTPPVSLSPHGARSPKPEPSTLAVSIYRAC